MVEVFEKQDKISNSNKAIGTRGSELNLHRKNNDECYTSMQDILNELSYWAEKDKFRGKNIICPCDWDIVEGEEIYSIRITYKDEDIEVVGNDVYKAVKSVQYDLWAEFFNDMPQVRVIDLKEDEIEDFLKNKLTCNFLRVLTQNARDWGIKSITASGYNPITNKGVKFQEVNFKSYDICITNPPFSLYGKFMESIVGKIDFVVLAPFLNRVNPNVGLPLMLKQAYIGTSGNSNAGYLSINFNNLTNDNLFISKQVACDWLVSWPDAQNERDINAVDTGISYDLYKDEYQEMTGMTMRDGTHPINVPSDKFPSDYNGWMFASINVITKLDLREYEWYGTNFMKYYNTISPASSPFNHNSSNEMVKKPDTGKGFHGVVFRKKPKTEDN